MIFVRITMNVGRYDGAYTPATGPFPNFEVEWQPSHQKKSGSFTKRYLTVLKKLAKEADEFIVATDFDVEGEVIGWNVVRFVAKQKDAKRMKFSLLTKEALQESFDSIHYAGIAFFKITIFVFTIIPYFALRIVG